jgi:hypothetical protein
MIIVFYVLHYHLESAFSTVVANQVRKQMKQHKLYHELIITVYIIFHQPFYYVTLKRIYLSSYYQVTLRSQDQITIAKQRVVNTKTRSAYLTLS